MRGFFLVWAGLWREPTRTAFTLAALAVGFLLFGLLQGVNAAFDASVARMRVDRLFTDPRFGELPLPLSDAERIEHLPQVEQLTWTVFLPAYYQDPKQPVLVIATDPARFFAVRNEFKLDPGQLRRFRETRTGLVVLQSLAQRLGWKVGDHVTLQSRVPRQDGTQNWNFEVVGLTDNPDNPGQIGFAVAQYAYFDEARANTKGTVGRLIVRIKDPHQSVDVGQTIDRLFANSAAPTRTQAESEVAQQQLATVGDVSRLTTAVMAAVFFAILFLTANMVLQSVRERRQELAVMRALGYSDVNVMILIGAEVLLMCVGAAVIGLAGAAVAFPVLSAYLPALSGGYVGSTHLSVSVMLAGLAVAVVLAMLGAALPVWQTRRLSVVEALRSPA